MSKAPSIHLPLFQRFDCQSCTYCCRHPVVPVSEQDRRRILAAGWHERMGGQELFVQTRSGGLLSGGRGQFRLARRDGGTCVFLGADNLCRLHAETGPQTKPLACRLFPFVIVPGVGGVRLDLRMDCPSVAGNGGRSLSVHRAEVQRLAAESGITRGSPRVPAWGAQRPISVREFEAVVAAFESILRTTSQPVRVRMRAGCQLIDLMFAARIEKVRDERFVELMELLATASMEEVGGADTGQNLDEGGDIGFIEPGSDQGSQQPPAIAPPLGERPARLFRQWLFLHTIADDPESQPTSRLARLGAHWRRYGQARQFAAGTGPVPRLRADWPETRFEAVDAVRPAPDEALEPLCRALRLKLDAHAFAGPAYFGYDLLSGLTALWLMPAVVGWLARLTAVGRGGDALTAEDVIAGVTRAHETFGVSPVFARVSERLRMRGLARPGVPAALLHRYGP